MIHYSLVATYVAVFAVVGAPQGISASETQPPKSAVSTTSFNGPLLAEAGSAKKTDATGPKVNVDKNGVILKGYDPVAYFKQNRAVKGDPKYSSSFGGATYYFASASDKETFDKTPSKYVPQYGAFCANGMKNRKLHDSDPNVFFIYKGKLYVCENPKAGKAFYADPDTNIKKADSNWQFYQPPTNPGFRRELGS